MKIKPKIKILPLRSDFGWFDPETKQIALSKILKSRPIPSKNFVKYHELFHKYVEEKGIKINPYEEELLCDYYALFKCRGRELSLLERQFKKVLLKVYGKNPSIETILTVNLKGVLNASRTRKENKSKSK
jgi:hypothetical protein